LRMLAKTLCLLFIIPCVLSTATLPADELFQNTLKRWAIKISSESDRSERWERFVKAKESVDRTTRGVVLESLNRFTVLNNEETERIVGPLKRALNSSKVSEFVETFNSRVSRQKRQYKDVEIPDTFNYWEEEVGLTTPLNQFGCGSCWAFPTVGTIEALYKEYTGEMAEFSQQYFVDCTFDGDGCGGGKINEGFKLTQMRQYMRSQEKSPYTANYVGCEYADDILTFTDNAMTKLWVGDYIPLSQNENALLAGLQTSPVAFGAYVSSDIMSYSGGPWTDSSCSADPNTHAMLLVGYTETTLRVKNSYGADWGDGGYADYERGKVTLDSCNFFKDAYALRVSHRRELEYEYSNGAAPCKYSDCRKSCEEMGTGWTLAVIPTLYHNQLLVEMLEKDYPGVKNDDKFNYLWIGLQDPDKESDYKWIDGSEVSYTNNTENTGKFGMINKNNGNWYFKNSQKYEARGLCSRAKHCRDITTSVKYGQVTFDNPGMTEGTVATITCDDGSTPQGESELTCSGGFWSSDLPSCSQ